MNQVGDKLFFTIIFSFSFLCLYSQDCLVAKDSLVGTYTGSCKNGKANGNGKAIGADSYEGEFKAGLPDGQGTYTWHDGTVYTGMFVKGQRQGKGTMKYKREGADSTLTGYWKNDKFIGTHEKSYEIYSLSKDIVNVVVKYKNDKQSRVNFLVVNTSSSTMSLGYGSAIKMKVDNINLSTGSYQRMENYDYMKKTETILFAVDYPLHMKVNISSETIDMELFDIGSYTIEVNINK